MSELLDGLDRTDLLRMEKLLKIKENRLDFALNHHRNTRDEPMQFDSYPHIRQVYNSVAPEIVLQGSVQSMKSEFTVIDHFAAAYSGLSIFFVVPKYESRTTYVQNRVNRAVENVGKYKEIIGSGFFDNVAMKSFGKGVIKYVGSNVLADFKEFPADMIVVEEVDECDQDNVEYALDRLRASPYQFKRYIGNPRVEGRGINKFFQRSDMREWHVPCTDCGELVELDWFSVVVDEVRDKDGNIVTYRLKDTEWNPESGRDIHCVCPHCGGTVERVSPKGQWIPKADSPIEGYHMSMLCSPINPITMMWRNFQSAIHDPLRMQQFYNSYLGLPYKGVGHRVTESLLDQCISDTDYQFVIDNNVSYAPNDGVIGPCSMGVDVGGNLDVRISESHHGKRRAVFIGKVKSFDDIHDLILQYNVEVCVVDSMPETQLVQDFQESAPIDVWLCRYGSEGADKRMVKNGSKRILNVDRTNALDRSFSAMKAKKNVLPANYRSICKGAYADEMCGPVRQTTEDGKGNLKYEWSKCKDHQRHADLYDMLAFNLMDEMVIDDVTIG
jgi:hypothetical protein